MSRPPDGLIDRILRRLERIPKGTALDTEQFPERDYPVHCLECGYALHGLPDGRCPECGHAFVRGELVVEIYARVMRPRRDVRRRLSWALWLMGMASQGLFIVMGGVVGGIQKLYPDYLPSAVSPASALRFVVGLFAMLVGGQCVLWASFLIDMTRLPPRQKRQAAHRALKVQLGRRKEP